MLGGNWEGGEPVGAQHKQHGMREGVEGEVGPVFRGRPSLEPREGGAASRVSRAQDPVVWRVAVKRRGLHGGREPRGRWVDLRGGAQDSEVCQATLVRDEEPERGRRGRRGPYIDFADAVHFDDCESYRLYKEGMRLRVYRDVIM